MPRYVRLMRILPLSLAVAMLVACGGDDTTGPDSPASTGEITVILESRSQDQVTVVQTAERQVSICYADGGCEGYLEASGSELSARGAGGAGNVAVLHTSDPNREAVGAIVEFEVEEGGTGVAHVVDRRIEDDFGVSFEDVADDVVESSDPFTDGDMVSFEAGTTE